MDRCAALFLGPHPDDVEIAAGGTILRLCAAGRRVVVVDVTGGEMGSRGTPEQRAREAAAAAAAMGVVDRRNLGLQDTRVSVDEGAVLALVGMLRAARPELLFAPIERDVHPDHSAVAQLAARAHFFSGLVRFAPDLGAPFRPRLLVRYPGNVPVEPSFVVDISAHAEQKAKVIGCYRSQLVAKDDGSHMVQGLDLVERARVRDRFYGARIGAPAAEPFVLDGPLPLLDPTVLLVADDGP